MDYSRTLLFGPGGSGKTLTAVLIALGLSIEQHDNAPLALVDSEGIAQFLKPICDIEGVELFVEPSRSFVDMQAALGVAIEAQCCAFVVDHYDGLHRELQESQKAVLNLHGRKLPYHQREELMRLWDAWVRQYRASTIHTIFNGRLAWDWGDAEDADGEATKVKLGTKARGDSDATYEPDLLIELERIDAFTRDKKSRKRNGEIQHVARVLKDRHMTLNGKSFTWSDLNAYKQGDYRKVWKDVAPHFVRPEGRAPRLLRPTGSGSASTALFSAPVGESQFAEAERRKAIALEEIDGVLMKFWPGRTAPELRLKNIVTETIFRMRSWTAIKGLAPEVLESAQRVMQEFELQSAGKDMTGEIEVIAAIQLAKDAQSERAEAVSLL